eukprot:scaffold6461_cov48-Attheya_sp.AAC.4
MSSCTILRMSKSEITFGMTTDTVLNHFSKFKEPALVSKFLIEQHFIEFEHVCFDYEVEENTFD